MLATPDFPSENQARPQHCFYMNRCEPLQIGGKRSREIFGFLAVVFLGRMKKSYGLESLLSRKQPLFLVFLDVIACAIRIFGQSRLPGTIAKKAIFGASLQRTLKHNGSQHYIKTMPKTVSNRNSVPLGCA
ncbi:hypothetical protein [Zunongwangia sp. H14]|uniref:hypothetical protein n=1 Tax=Zunongwangia sp. H14 TaxID=3240792 RepID=UPI003567ACB8